MNGTPLRDLDINTLQKFHDALEPHCPRPILEPKTIAGEESRIQLAWEAGRRSILDEIKHHIDARKQKAER